MNGDRERLVTRAFVSLATDLADGLDAIELLSDLTQQCSMLLDVASAGLLLADPHGVLHVAAASSEATRDLELYQTQREQGPCLECYQRGVPVIVPDLQAAATRFPLFARAASEAGFASVHALPMRLRENRLGALGLFNTEVGALDDDDLGLATALAHVASVAIVQGKASTDKDLIAGQLQQALDSRIVIEQAKGLLAQDGAMDMDEAFAVLRLYSRDHNLRLSELTRALIARELPAAYVIEHARAKQAHREQSRRSVIPRG